MQHKKIKRSTLIPSVLLVYLAVMSVIGYRTYSSGAMGPAEYFGIIGATLVVIAMLHFFIKKREKIRDERDKNL